jgi:signal transduction histidine kinase
VFVNDAFLNILGLSKQISRKELFACLPEALNEVGMTSVFERVSLTGVHESIEKFLVDRKIWVLASVYSIEKGYFAVLLEDITERKQVEENLKSYSKELEFLVEERTKKLKDSERLAAIGETAGMVGHDIRNPLQAITGDLYLLKEEFESLSKRENGTSIQESIKAIEDNVFYINKIVSDLQDYTRTLKPSIQEVYLRSLINSILLNASIPDLIKTSAKIQEGLILNTDPDYLRRALTNIITNAYQAMPNGGQLTLSAEKKENITVITVEDTGIGISPEIKSKLFTPLFTTKSKGQGLGLAVSKRLIEALNGDITVESKEGEGTKFVITLPA